MTMQSKLMEESKKNEERLKAISPSNRILLISHCLRSSKKCTAKMTKAGLMCRDDCPDRCTVGRLRLLAEKAGYKGVCIAPGGSMALKFIKENKPEGIVAIACMRELEEGVCAVKEFAGIESGEGSSPVIVPVPLLRDGCVDTEVDEEEAKRIINL
ncbi:MAG: DUF116 domain-containing protein [Actinomycetia bacterium]|nr:DUF116 domain-containing protein [Actinomycetes bacterium]